MFKTLKSAMGALKIIGSALLLMLFANSNSFAGSYEKIPIEQAIKEAQMAHEMCRQTHIREFTQQKNLKEVLGEKGALPTQYQYDVKYYKIVIGVNFGTEIITGYVDQTSVATQNGVTFCEVDIYANMTVDSLKVDGVTTTGTRTTNVLKINLPVTKNTGDQFTVTTYYHGHPVEGGFQAFAFETNTSGDNMCSTLSEPYLARTWWPCKDYPDDRADSVDVIMTYPSNLVCSSNGVLASDVNNGDGTRTTFWKIRYSITTYLVCITITNFQTWRDWFHYGVSDSMPVDFWAYPNQASSAQVNYAVTVPMLDTLSRLYGLYPFTNEKYGMSMFNWGGAMEHQTNTSIYYNAQYQSIIVHEMGHQWWGDMITCRDWHHIWLNEGFASYTEALWFESQGGFASLQSYMNGMRFTGGGSIYIQDTTNIGAIFGSIVYDKAAWVLHALRHVVGDSTFFNILHTYYNDPRYKFKDAVTENFRDICDSVSGMNLNPFFQDWIYGTYFPIYTTSFSYDATGPNAYRVYVHVRQSQSTNPTVFHMPKVDLRITAGSNYNYVIADTTRDADFVYNITGASSPPSAITIDPDVWILKTANTEAYAVHIIYDTLKTGSQGSFYKDSVTVRGGSTPYSFQIVGGSLPVGLSLNSASGIISGTTSFTGLVQVQIKATGFGGSNDTKNIKFYINPISYLPGDANNDGTVNISDAVYLIAFIFSGGPAPVVTGTGDANGDCTVNIGDAVYLIAYIFSGGPGPVPGC